MEKRLIPYSVHLPEETYRKIKDAAGDRKASSIVREAIVSYLGKEDLYKSGYQAGLAAAIKKIGNHKIASALAYNGETMADILIEEIRNIK